MCIRDSSIAIIQAVKQHKNPSPLLRTLRSIRYAEVAASVVTLQDVYKRQLQSAGVPLLAGSAIGSAWRNQQQDTDAKWLDYFRGLLSGTVKAGNTATEMPMVQGISEVLGGDYEQQGTGESLTKIALTGASQILPFGSLGRQISNEMCIRDRSTGVTIRMKRMRRQVS